ncbi:hypothetical protein C823_003926 [Eubacterium plexicaudatum ASF492]|uniref:Calpastatin n=1 Tax=Eubacterium plexicaudatum ASF492 TaxID=1235802 RepID=N2A0Q3_9FIRM|nr:hypothetical protein C823_003926 [Eubacterium plexicaudatum ASF492]
MEPQHLNRFIDVHLRDYPNALSEIKNGRKQSHWMWYIFPQIAGLGTTEISNYYSIRDIEEARDYMREPLLRSHLLEISRSLLELECCDANKIFGFPDDMKLKSSMTLFSEACPEVDVFQKVLDKFFNGMKDQKTIEFISQKRHS